MDDERARVELLDGEAIMRRDAREAHFRTETPLDADELVHPLLGYAALAFANWIGREAFHAGVFLSGGSAWALLGQRGSGKSSTLALARAQRSRDRRRRHAVPRRSHRVRRAARDRPRARHRPAPRHRRGPRSGATGLSPAPLARPARARAPLRGLGVARVGRAARDRTRSPRPRASRC